MAKPEKVSAVSEISDKLTNSTATVLTEYRGLTVSQLTTLRRQLGATTTYKIVKNTLTKRAAHEAGVTSLDDLLEGPTAIAFIEGDPVEAAKGLRDFAKANPQLIIKGGILDGKTLSADEVNKIADLESREVLLAKVAGILKANLSKAASLFQAPLSQMARLAQALEDQQTAAAKADAAADAPAEASADTAEAPADS